MNVTTLNIVTPGVCRHSHVTSTMTSPFDAPWALSYRLSIEHEPLNRLVSEIFSIKVADTLQCQSTCLFVSQTDKERNGTDCAVENEGSPVIGEFVDGRGLEFNYSGTADARAAVTWPCTEVAARLSPLPNCSFMFQSFDSRIFELGDCFMAQSSPG